MSLDVYLTATRPTEVYSGNVTHNLGGMAQAAGIYEALWRPEEIGVTTAAQMIPLLEDGLAKLKADPDKFRALNAQNSWGTYDKWFLPFVQEYLAACRENPDATIRVSR